MILGIQDYAPLAAAHSDDDWHVLVVTRDPAARYSIASLLLDAGFRVTNAATFGVVEILLNGSEMFDVMVTAQSAEEITEFGVAQLARSIDPDLPILVLEFDTANSPVVIELVNSALSRWPLRARENRALH
jgi:CheY-like chemotaxis protein